MSSEWDMPEGSAPSGAQRKWATTRSGEETSAGAGTFDPLALVRFILANFVKIAVIALVLAAIGIVLVSFIPFPYRATATILVDPRNQQVTLQEDVVQPIGSDVAVLESMVQIMRSDGFLLNVMDKLGMLGGVEDKLSEADQLKALAKFKSNLNVERKGATYLVEISYKADTAQEAARIANMVANEFANQQNADIKSATEAAGRTLTERLVELRRKLNASEKAVADFAAENGILYVDNDNTLQKQQLSELSAQLAVAKNATEAARARYQSQMDGAGGNDVVLSDPSRGETQQLVFLRQQRAQLKQQLDQQSLTYGARHPRIAQTRQALEGIERQIREERQNLTRQLKGELDVAEAQQNKLQDDIARLSSGAVLSDAAEVRLDALKREASADRDIYEKFLSRNKTTDELAAITSDNVRVVSPAVPPLRSSKPSIILLAPIFGLLGAVAATTAVAVTNRSRPAERRPRRVLDPKDPPPAGEATPRPTAEETTGSAQPAHPRPASNALLMMGRKDAAAPPTRQPLGRSALPQSIAPNSLLMMAETMRAADEGPGGPPSYRRFR
jgi:uncharacterized protein involved in exopolysaccharide biosynthesis